MSERGRHKIHGRSAGKGSSPRNCFSEQFRKNYDRIFRKKKTFRDALTAEGTLFNAFNGKDQ